MKNLTWQNPEQLFVAQVLINKVKSKCCGIKVESEQLPILSSWLNTQAQDNMNKVYQMMSWIYHNGGCVAINEIKRDVQNGKLQ